MLESSCTGVYTLVPRVASSRTSSSLTSFISGLLLFFVSLLITSNANALPPEGISKKPPITAAMGFSFTNLYDISMPQKSFKFSGYIWWYVTPLTSTYVPYDRTDVINAKEYSIKPHHIYDAEPNYYEAKINANVSQEWELRQFPFDSQELHINFEDNGYDASRLLYTVDREHSRINPYLKLDDWKVMGDSISTHLDSGYSEVRITIKIKRLNSGWLFFHLFIGTFVGVLLCLLGFFMRLDSDIRFSLFLGAIFAVVTNQHILYEVLPRTSYLTLSDKIQIATFILLIFTIIIHVILKKLAERRRAKFGHYLNKRMGIALFLSYCSFVIFVVHHAIVS